MTIKNRCTKIKNYFSVFNVIETHHIKTSEAKITYSVNGKTLEMLFHTFTKCTLLKNIGNLKIYRTFLIL